MKMLGADVYVEQTSARGRLPIPGKGARSPLALGWGGRRRFRLSNWQRIPMDWERVFSYHFGERRFWRQILPFNPRVYAEQIKRSINLLAAEGGGREETLHGGHDTP